MCRFNINTITEAELFPEDPNGGKGIIPQMGPERWSSLETFRRDMHERGEQIIDPETILDECDGVGKGSVAAWMPLFSFLPSPALHDECPCWHQPAAPEPPLV